MQRTYLGFDSDNVRINSFNWSANCFAIVSPAIPLPFGADTTDPAPGLPPAILGRPPAKLALGAMASGCFTGGALAGGARYPRAADP